jgi:hypothetical protein
MIKRARNGRLKKQLMMVQTSRDASFNSLWSPSSDSAETSWTTTRKLSGKCLLILRSNSGLKIERNKERIFSRPSSKNGSTLLMPFLK